MPEANENQLRTFQRRLHQRLETLFRGIEARMEWAAMATQPGVYSPRLDNAVGPFATEDRKYGERYDEMVEQYSTFLRGLHDRHIKNSQTLVVPMPQVAFESLCSFNYNSRCFLGIEIENEVSRKHLMGGAINAAALGRFGIVIGWTPDKVRALLNLVRYLQFLGEVGKNTFRPHNLWVLSPQQFWEAITEELRARV